MKRDEVLAEVRQAFAGIARPATFIRGTCKCDECLEHEATMQGFDSGELPLERLDNPGWDPICFASNDAYLYLMPGLARLVVDYTEEYACQFLFQLGFPERMAAFDPTQARALLQLLDLLECECSSELDNSAAGELLDCARDKLQQRADAKRP